MEDEVARVILQHSNIGQYWTFPTGDESEMHVINDTKEKLANAEMTTRDGSTHIKLEGKFSNCAGAIGLQVCLKGPVYLEIEPSENGKEQ